MLAWFLLALMSAVLAVPAGSQAAPTPAAETDTLDVYETRHNHLLALPKHLWNALIYPIGQFTIWAVRISRSEEEKALAGLSLEKEF